jgi:TonB-linked SusC/RagA family outer membrane protein
MENISCKGKYALLKSNFNIFFRIMRITCLLLAFCISTAFATTVNSQNARVTLSANSMTVRQLVMQIEKQTDYLFVVNSDKVDLNQQVQIGKRQNSVKNILDDAFRGKGLLYKMEGENIVLMRQQQKKTTVVKGKVVDEKGLPIIGASVVEIGAKSNGTISDADGSFSLSISKSTSDLEISYIGYHTQTIRVVAGKTVTVRLTESTKALDEVVVVGYGTMKKRDLTGAITSVKMNDEPVSTVSTISHALAGEAAGLQVSTISAQPGGSSTFRIRGAASVSAGNDPLIIIDGFPVNPASEVNVGYYNSGDTDNILGSLNPNDIESIEVLKDASSTAIYGARAGNGVIIITTKKGKTGTPIVTYSGNFSVQKIARNYEMLNASDFMTQTNRYFYEQWMKDNGIGVYGNKTADQATTAYKPYYTDAQIANPENDTDWMKAVTRSGFQTQHNISISGGTEMTKYLLSGNFFRQDGIIKNNDYSRYTGRFNIDQQINKYFKAGLNLTFSRIQSHDVPLGSGQNEASPVLVAAAQFNPLIPVRNADGSYAYNTNAGFLPNPVSLLEITNKSVKERVLANATVEYKPFADLVLKANFGIDRNYQKRSTYLPKTTLYGQKKNGSAEIGQYDKSDYLMELTANYTKRIGDHNITALAGYSFQRFTDEYLYGSNSNFLTDGFLYNNLGAGSYAKPGVGSSASKNEMASFFGRLNYTYKDRYLLTATLRADGASNFASNHRWGYFPSIALGWRFSDEAFMQKYSNWLSNGKLRLSYGQTGNSNIGNKAISYYQTGFDNEFGGVESVGVYLSQLGNPDLKWETTSEWNFGLDLGFFNNRVNVTAEYFNKTVSDLLNTRSLMSYNEVNTIAANTGKTQSRGFELTVNTTNIDTKDLKWTSTFTFSFYRDKWKERDSQWKPSAYSTYHSPIRYLAGYLSDGLVQPGETVTGMNGALPGQVKIKDIDGYVYNSDGTYEVDKYGIPLKSGKPDGKIDDADKVIYGSTDPGYLAGLNNSLRWKNFDLNIYFYGQFKVLNAGNYKDMWISSYPGVVNLYRGYNMPDAVKDCWSHDNLNGSRPGFFQTSSTYGLGDYFVRKSWFIRCRNITLGYTIPVKPSILSRMRIYVDANNLFMISPYKGLDLETDNSTWAYPNVRTFSVGLDITF